MTPHRLNVAAPFLAIALAVSWFNLDAAAGARRAAGGGAAPAAPQKRQKKLPPFPDPLQAPVEHITERDAGQNGITVAEPKIYDDALLQQMLRAAEQRLATLQLIDQPSILARLGVVTGASQQVSAFGLNVQGAPVPGVTTTSKGATGSTTEAEQLNASGVMTGGTLTTVSGLPAQDVTTTRSAFSPPTATAPSPTTTLPSSFSVSASDILNEQMQLSAEVNGLRLLLAGSLSDYFVNTPPEPNDPDAQQLTKLKTTLGFHVTVAPDRRYKDAVAIVEVEVGTSQPITSEKPAVTAIIPREKTYNVAVITDKSSAISGGVATQLIGVSGSFMRARRSYYLVQDQDTVALTYRPADGKKTGFRWQFRPVLGQHYVKAGLKQTFVQLAFPTLQDAREGEIGRVTVRTYWRKYDSKAGILKEIIPGSYREMFRDQNILSFRQPVMPIAFNAFTGIEDLGGGQMFVKLEGRFLPGTYVRIGSTMLTDGTGLKHEHNAIKFTAPVATLAARDIFLVSQDGSERKLQFPFSRCGPGREKDCGPAQAPVCSPGHSPVISELKAEAIDETTSRLRVRVAPAPFAEEGALPRPVFVIGQRVFGHADAPLKVEEEGQRGQADHKVFLSAVVPNAVYTPTAELVVKPLFAPNGCTSNALPIGPAKPPGTERLTFLERTEREVRFLLTGTGLRTVRALSPAGARVEDIFTGDGSEKMRVLVLKPEHIDNSKQVLLQRGDERPFLVTIPELDPKKPSPPKALERITVGSDEAVIVGDGMSNLESMSFRDQPFTTFKVLDDKTLRLSGLRALGVTAVAATYRFSLKFKAEARPRDVDIEVVNTKVETLPRATGP